MRDNIQYEAYPAMFRNRPFSFVLCLIPIFWPVLLVWRIRVISNKIQITDKAVFFEQGLLSKSRIDLRINDISRVDVNQNVIQRMLGAGDLMIYTAGDLPEIVINGVKDPHRVRELLDG